MTYTPAQKHAIDCVLAIFETGKIPTAASYSTCTILKDGAGISYGKHQSTDHSNSLDLVVKRYITLGGQHAAALQHYVPRLAANETTKLNPAAPDAWALDLINLLRQAGADPLMQRAQDEIFDENYFAPAVNHAKQIGLTKALSLLVIYDTCIHSGPGRVGTHRAVFAEKSPANGGDEAAWVKAYLNARRLWLLSSTNPLVQKTVYRIDALLALVNAGNWDLAAPLVVRGVKIA